MCGKHLHSRRISLRVEDWIREIRLTMTHVASSESERSCICMVGVRVHVCVLGVRGHVGNERSCIYVLGVMGHVYMC